jgi:hypothetical protein
MRFLGSRRANGEKNKNTKREAKKLLINEEKKWLKNDWIWSADWMVGSVDFRGLNCNQTIQIKL